MREVLVVGESLVDIVPGPDGTERELVGGSALNTAVGLARLGRRTHLATAVGRDDRGREILRRLAEEGVDLAAEPHVLDRTSTARVTLDASGEATYAFDLAWRLAPLTLPTTALLVHVGSIGAVLAPGADRVVDIARGIRESGGVVSYDVNARSTITGAVVGAVERVVGLAHLVRASEQDLAQVYPSLPPDRAVARLLALGPEAVVLTEGPSGARWVDRAGEVRVPAVPVDVVDTVGAGDAFGAALLDAVADLGVRQLAAGIARDRVRILLERAARAAALAVSRAGADPAYAVEL